MKKTGKKCLISFPEDRTRPKVSLRGGPWIRRDVDTAYRELLRALKVKMAEQRKSDLEAKEEK